MERVVLRNNHENHEKHEKLACKLVYCIEWTSFAMLFFVLFVFALVKMFFHRFALSFFAKKQLDTITLMA